MFDTYIKREKQTEYVPYEKKVTIHRAPTDESVKLYEEFKKKAYDSILDSISINNNILNFSAIVYRDPYSYKTSVRYKILVNGREMTGEVELKHGYDYPTVDRSTAVQKIFEDLAESLTLKLLTNMLSDSVNGLTIREK